MAKRFFSILEIKSTNSLKTNQSVRLTRWGQAAAAMGVKISKTFAFFAALR